MTESAEDPRLVEAQIANLEAETAKMQAETKRTESGLLYDEEHRAETKAHGYHHGLFDFSGGVTDANVSGFIKNLGEFSRRYPQKPLTIVFNSPGGSVFAGLALYDYIGALKEAGHQVTTKTIGMAASMGGILLQVGHERVAGANSYMLIHEVSNGMSGKVSEMDDNLKFTKRLQDRLLGILAERSTLSIPQIRTRWVKRDWWLDSDEMLKLGFVDRIQ